jgi:hypothetical protein
MVHVHPGGSVLSPACADRVKLKTLKQVVIAPSARAEHSEVKNHRSFG